MTDVNFPLIIRRLRVGYSVECTWGRDSMPRVACDKSWYFAPDGHRRWTQETLAQTLRAMVIHTLSHDPVEFGTGLLDLTRRVGTPAPQWAGVLKVSGEEEASHRWSENEAFALLIRRTADSFGWGRDDPEDQ